MFVNQEWTWKDIPPLSSGPESGASPTTFDPPVRLGGNPMETM